MRTFVQNRLNYNILQFQPFSLGTNFLSFRAGSFIRKKFSGNEYANAGSNSRKTRLESTRHFGTVTTGPGHTEYANADVIAQKSQFVVYATLT